MCHIFAIGLTPPNEGPIHLHVKLPHFDCSYLCVTTSFENIDSTFMFGQLKLVKTVKKNSGH